MKKAPLVSVVMSVYNGEKYVRESIGSILAQTFTNFEFIIINDGSTDNTQKILDSFQDKRIVLLEHKNKGLVASLNEGIEKAHGTYIARQDADDASMPRRLATQVAYLDDHPEVGVLGTFAELVNESGERQGVYETPYLAQDIKRRLYLGNTLVHGSIMARRDLLQAHPYVSLYGPTEDYVLWGELSLETDLAVLPLELYSYQLNEDGNSAFNSREDIAQTLAANKSLWSKQVFPADSVVGIIGRGRIYKNAGPRDVYSQYLSDQVQLIGELRQYHMYKPLIITLIGLLVLSPRALARSILLISRSHS